MQLLNVKNGKIVKTSGEEVVLRGTTIGAWMNMEHFMNSFPGNESNLRYIAKKRLGNEIGEYFFESFLDNFFTEDDVDFISSLGANVLRIPLNYRHFESDNEPFKYLEDGFKRLDKVIKWCEKNNIYVILDMHAVQGYQSTDWHCDNTSRRSMFWDYKHFQDRFISLWVEFAKRYKERSVIAGYNLMNEPMTEAERGRVPLPYEPNWDNMNKIYKKTVKAIREYDPEHIVFLEGDFFSQRFEGLDEPFADNLVYSSHNYSDAGRGQYPGVTNAVYWDKEAMRKEFYEHEGTKFAKKHNVPLWIGEFGFVRGFTTDAYVDQIEIFEEFGAHWTGWSYKDTDVMSLVRCKPDCEYFKRIAPVITKIYPVGNMDKTEERKIVEKKIVELGDAIEKAIGHPDFIKKENYGYLSMVVEDGYYNSMLQPMYIDLFKGMSKNDIDKMMQSLRFENCIIHPLSEIFKKFYKQEI